MSEMIHHSGKMSPESGQQCSRCKLQLVEANETPFAADEDIYVDARGNNPREYPMINITPHEDDPLYIADDKVRLNKFPRCEVVQ